MAAIFALANSKMFVYLLRSISFPDETYVGLTEDMEERLMGHNSGKSPHTKKFKPWIVQIQIWFENREKAIKFERYLKTGSGIAFRRKHF